MKAGTHQGTDATLGFCCLQNKLSLAKRFFFFNGNQFSCKGAFTSNWTWENLLSRDLTV